METGVVSCTMDLGQVNLIDEKPKTFPSVSLRKPFVRAGRSGFLFSETADEPNAWVVPRPSTQTGHAPVQRGDANLPMFYLE